MPSNSVIQEEPKFINGSLNTFIRNALNTLLSVGALKDQNTNVNKRCETEPAMIIWLKKIQVSINWNHYQLYVVKLQVKFLCRANRFQQEHLKTDYETTILQM